MTSACGDAGPTTPTAATPAASATAHLTFHVYNSVIGELPAAGFTKTVQAGTSAAFPSVSINLADLLVVGVDSRRAVLRLVHQGDQVGSFVSRTANGTLTLTPTGDATLDLFLMSTATGADYDCLDYTGESVAGASTDFPRLRRLTVGTIFNTPIVDGPDEPLQVAAEQFNKALNPFGVRYGQIDYIGAVSSNAELTAGWVKIADGGNRGGSGYLTVVVDGANQQLWAPIYVLHELGHAYLGAPDYYQNTGCFRGSLSCALMDCAGISATLTPFGADAVRYWSLMNRRRLTTSVAFR